MIEDVWETDGAYTIRKSAAPWQHVRPAGEDLAESEMVMPSHHRIRPHEIGALATYGITHPEVIAVQDRTCSHGQRTCRCRHPPGSRAGRGEQHRDGKGHARRGRGHVHPVPVCRGRSGEDHETPLLLRAGERYRHRLCGFLGRDQGLHRRRDRGTGRSARPRGCNQARKTGHHRQD